MSAPLFVCPPWHPVPVECRASRIGELCGSRETHPGLGERSHFAHAHPSKMVDGSAAAEERDNYHRDAYMNNRNHASGAPRPGCE